MDGSSSVPEISADDPYAALGVVGAMKDIKKLHRRRKHGVCLQSVDLSARS